MYYRVYYWEMIRWLNNLKTELDLSITIKLIMKSCFSIHSSINLVLRICDTLNNLNHFIVRHIYGVTNM